MPNIPQSRLVLYLIVAGLLPVVLVLFNFMTKLSDLDLLQNKLQDVKMQAFVRERKQSLNMIVRKNFQNADHFYIDKNLETLSFLKPEIETLQKLINNKYFAGDEMVKKRLDMITGPDNKLLFTEANIQKYPYFQETTASLVHPVEINLNDLKEILALVEGEPIGQYQSAPNRPQLIITDFKLDKKEASDKNDVFLLNLKLLKREYTK